MIYEGVNIKYCDWVIKEINIKKIYVLFWNGRGVFLYVF